MFSKIKMASFIVIVYHYPVHISLPLRKISTPITKVDFTNHHYISMSSSSSWDVYLGFFIITSWFWTSFLMSPPAHKTQHFKIGKKAIWRIFFKETKCKNHFLGISKKKSNTPNFCYSLDYEKIIRGPFPIFSSFGSLFYLWGLPTTLLKILFLWNGETVKVLTPKNDKYISAHLTTSWFNLFLFLSCTCWWQFGDVCD